MLLPSAQYWPGAIVSRNSDRGFRSEIRPHDLFASREPHPVVTFDVGERRVERPDTVRHAGHEGMQADRHHTRRFPAFRVQHVERVPYDLAEILAGCEAIV